eukprot:scaffold29140_cov50-Cyclotella_meneghiniana.AAC.1
MPRIPPLPEIKVHPPPKSRLAFIKSLPSYIQQFAVDDAFMTNCIPPPGSEIATCKGYKKSWLRIDLTE